MAESISKDEFISAYKTAPSAVRDAMESAETLKTIDYIGSTYSLHVDVVGQISKLIGYMLLGLLAPNAFYQSIIELGVSTQSASAIVKDINERIFLPLRDRIRQGASSETEPIDDDEAEYDPTIETPTPTTAPPKVITPQVPVMQVPTTQQAPTAVQPTPPPYNLVRPDALVPVPEAKIRTMQTDIAGLEHSSQMTPASIFRTASVPFTSNQNLSTPAAAQKIQPLAPNPPQVPPFTQTQQEPPVTQARGTDPYREPV